ncbi:peptidase domain-containing ABC transporter [Algivirga pacifica]|uniref:Peptidase domain-containing ABC transporter n=2 Tax=Algivirga pacifica TaxID=1162670 RepID=A0ABP9DMI0_9BACT
MIAAYYGRVYPLEYLRTLCHIDREGVSLLGLSKAAESLGFRTQCGTATYEFLSKQAHLPCIVYWQQSHFLIVYKIKNNKVYVADPGSNLICYSKEEFLTHWITDPSQDKGVIMLLEPQGTLPHHESNDEIAYKNQGLSILIPYLRPYKKLLIQLFIGFTCGSLLIFIFPFLTQSLIDIGVQQQDYSFVSLILLAQLLVFVGETALGMLRSWIILHICSRINIHFVTDFLTKLMQLPIAFFDRKNLGDILQRIEDSQRIRHFLTNTTFDILFSTLNLIVFGIVLSLYNLELLLLFILGSSVYVGWITIFLKYRKKLDYKRFSVLSSNQSNEVYLVQGMQEIMLNNCEQQKRAEWESIQMQLFQLDIKGLNIDQFQEGGARFLNQLKNIVITFVAAKLVIEGELSLGMMLSISYMLGQMNVPLLQLIDFLQLYQDTSISVERIEEIEREFQKSQKDNTYLSNILPKRKDIVLEQVHFRYGNYHGDWILKDISCIIPYGKHTAIVGESGSGKTTLMKLLLGIYAPEKGQLSLGKHTLSQLAPEVWRNACGTVMQDGFIFADSIERNIAPAAEYIDRQQLQKAAKGANIREMIEELPLQYKTKIGGIGIELSGGQKQRILIARALYKNPDYLFFDEATSALDTTNEHIVATQLQQLCKDKTLVTIAHRLSTVRNADQIIVMHQGSIVETGTHEALLAREGYYYELVKNQLETH